jgi:hypothetical protein
MAKGGRGQTNQVLLPKGQYQLSLLMFDPDLTALGQRVFDVTIQTQQNSELHTIKTDRIDIFKQTGQVNSIFILQYPVELQNPGSVNVTLKPVKDKAIICGAILESKSLKNTIK